MDLEKNKSKRREKFRLKVVEMVGGEDSFNSKVFDELMQKGGGKLETIVEAVKIKPSEDGITDSTKIAPEGLDVATEEENKGIDSKEYEKKIKKKEENDLVNESEAKEKETSYKGEENESVIKTIQEKQKEDVDDRQTPDDSNLNDDEEKEQKESDLKQKDNKSTAILSDSEEEEDLTLPLERKRGRRRRGRQDADGKREVQNKIQKEQLEKREETKSVQNDKKNPNEDRRRCKGRKALTDYEIGKKYSGTVVYVKPKLGVFIDIGCHSDAFCHISRCSDIFVESITENIFKVGDILEEKVRIVHIDREKKKVTVSLQSDEKVVDEEKSNESWQKRKEDRNAKKGMKRNRKNVHSSSGDDFRRNAKINEEKPHTPSKDTLVEEFPEVVVDPENMTPAELKRARKLQRRAERRRQQELTGIAA